MITRRLDRRRVVLLAGALACTSCVPAVPRGTSVPFGAPAHGYLHDGVALPNRGLGFIRARPGDDVRWGTRAMIQTITRAAASVERAWPGGGPLRVGDLAARWGGGHPRHRSHRTGRDADLMFFVSDLEDRPIAAPGVAVFDRFGLSRSDGGRRVRFDVARNWHLVRTLLRDPDAPAQWIFCSWGVKRQLLAYALDHEPDADVLLRAAYVLHQPTGALPHDDHFHLRIACTARDRAAGCADQGPLWPWHRADHEKPEIPAGTALSDEFLIEALIADLEDPPARDAATAGAPPP